MLIAKPNIIFLSARQKVFDFNQATQSICGLQRQAFGRLFNINETDSIFDRFEALKRAQPQVPLVVILHPLYSEYFEPHVVLDTLHLLDFNCFVYLYFEAIDFRDIKNIQSALTKIVDLSKYRQVMGAFVYTCDQQKIFKAIQAAQK